MLDGSATDWNLGTPDDARFEQEYLLAVGARAQKALRQRAAPLVRSAPLAGLSRAHFAILSEPEMTSPSSVTSTGAMFWPLSSADLAARRVEGVAQDPEPVGLLHLRVPAGVPQRLVGVSARMAARTGRAERSPAHVELHMPGP